MVLLLNTEFLLLEIHFLENLALLILGKSRSILAIGTASFHCSSCATDISVKSRDCGGNTLNDKFGRSGRMSAGSLDSR